MTERRARAGRAHTIPPPDTYIGQVRAQPDPAAGRVRAPPDPAAGRVCVTSEELPDVQFSVSGIGNFGGF
jgi:hypothetical protein